MKCNRGKLVGLSAAEREAADINAAAAKKRIAEEHHAGRLKGAQALYVGQREIKDRAQGRSR